MTLPRSDGRRGAARQRCATSFLRVRDKRVRPGLDDKVLADWNGLMIAALANAGAHAGRAGLDRHGASAPSTSSRAAMTRGDRLGHSWRDGRLLFPGLASDFAAMIRAALALYEATGQGALSRAGAGLAARARSRITPTRTTAAISSPPTTPRAWWCGPPRPPTTPRPTRTPIAAQNLVRLAALDRRPCLARAGRPAVRRRARAARPRTCSARRRCSTRSTCGCAPPRSW